MTLGPDWILTSAQRKRLPARSEEVAMEGLRELVDDPLLGLAARQAIRCVEGNGADPRTMLLVLEGAQEGWFRERGPAPDSGGA